MLVRMLRLARLARLVRLMRFRMFHELKLMVLGLFSGLRALAWAIVLLMFTIYTFGVLMKLVSQDLPEFSSMPSSMFTLVIGVGFTNLIMAVFIDNESRPRLERRMLRCEDGIEWSTFKFVRDTSAAVCTDLKLQFRRFLCEDTTAASQRGLFSRLSNSARQKLSSLTSDDYYSDQATKKKIAEATYRILQEDKVSISREMFSLWLQDAEFTTMLEEADVDMSDKFRMFDILDVDMGGELSPDELVTGLMQLRGDVSKGDIVAIMLKAPWQNHRIPMNSVDHAAAFPGPTPHICDRGNTTRSLQNMFNLLKCTLTEGSSMPQLRVPYVQAAAILALEALSGRLAVADFAADLATGLESEEVSARWGALKAMRALGVDAVEPYSRELAMLLSDDSWYVRSLATDMLLELGPRGAEESQPVLVKALHNLDQEVRSTAAIALGRHGQVASQHAAAVCSRMLANRPGVKSDDPDADLSEKMEVRVACMWALGQFHPDSVVPLLHNLDDGLFHRNTEYRLAATEALTNLGPRAVALRKDHLGTMQKTPMEGPWPAKMKVCVLANGCFWGSEKGFWRLPGGGVYSTAVGYAAGRTPNPTYEECCSGQTGATEAVQVVYDPEKVRSALIFFDREQEELMRASKDAYEKALQAAGKGMGPRITTEIVAASDFEQPFYYAEDYHQQYLAKPGARPYCSAQPLQAASFPNRNPPSLRGFESNKYVGKEHHVGLK
eukprot:g20260.t1